MTDHTTSFSAGRFSAMTGLSAKALRLYGERGVLEPVAVDPNSGYRSYSLEQVREGVTLDLLRRANIGLGDLVSERRDQFDDHRARLSIRRAMEDFYIDLAERVSGGDPHALELDIQRAPAADWIAVDILFAVPSDPDGAQTSFTAMATDLPALDQTFLAVLRDHDIELAEESWTTSTEDADPCMRLAHRVSHPVAESERARVETALSSVSAAAATVSTGTLPERQEHVYSLPTTGVLDDEGIADTALSYLATIAFAHRLAEHGSGAVAHSARRRVRAISMFAPDASPKDVFDLLA
ncbi:MerR family transcriptional regulator [Microbacterium radiodurans]|uniref:MerR family transcriptional regulator n=1 Tax=Microbacterium radiodurans TaxID=661398 RepID=A0A5J5IMD6_9MICO|nr:MerR family transcriptional regulator [Microbacterium radiodurans]KAA9083750.1 MerR family transcriptional regulator [Microbacterium radiodurans]